MSKPTAEQRKRYAATRRADYWSDPDVRQDARAYAAAYRARWAHSPVYRELAALRSKLAKLRAARENHERYLEDPMDRRECSRARRIVDIDKQLAELGPKLVKLERRWKELRQAQGSA